MFYLYTRLYHNMTEVGEILEVFVLEYDFAGTPTVAAYPEYFSVAFSAVYSGLLVLEKVRARPRLYHNKYSESQSNCLFCCLKIILIKYLIKINLFSIDLWFNHTYLKIFYNDKESLHQSVF